MFQKSLEILDDDTPCCYAFVRGNGQNEAYKDIKGMVLFYKMGQGMLVVTDLEGLPVNPDACGGAFFGFHIHEGEACSGNATDAFADAGAHLNPENCEHPQHMGDMPVLIESGGKCFSVFYTERFNADDIRGKTVIVHSMPDDFRSQPAGDSGEKMACGTIRCTLFCRQDD
ncbi:MAG: superoxide dismutase family protein [Lachnospiraceae bacterium]|nr:superoxide dismutase family protein [Lachnospiraceae bacterium]